MNPTPLLLLARALPRRAARPLGDAWGRLAFGLLRGRRQRAEENLRRAFPDAGAAALTRLARRSFAHNGAALADLAALERLDPGRLCRHLRFDGWDHLAATESHQHGVLLLAPRMGSWHLAVLAVGLYRGPTTTCGELAEESLLGRLAASVERRLGHPVVEATTEEEARRRLATGARVVVAGDSPLLAAGAPIVPILARPEPGGAYRIVVREPIVPAAEADPEQTARHCREAVAREARGRPELAAWWRSTEP